MVELIGVYSLRGGAVFAQNEDVKSSPDEFIGAAGALASAWLTERGNAYS